MRPWPVTAIAFIAAAAVAPAAAQDHQPFHPTRDVMVEYHIDNTNPGGQRSDTVRMYFTDRGDKIRIEPLGQPGWSIVDRNAHSMTLVMAAQHMFIQMPYDPKRVMTFDETGATLTRVGTDTVAGIGCTVYKADRDGHHGQVCLSNDGVLLRAHSEDPGHTNDGMEAVKVAYAPQPASLFVPPPDYRRMDTASMMRGMQPPK